VTEIRHPGAFGRPVAILLALLCILAACHTARVVDRAPPKEPAAEENPAPPALAEDEIPPANPVEVPIETPPEPPGLPPEAPPPKRRPRPKPEPPPPLPPVAAPAAPAPDAEVKPLDNSVVTVLGKKVEGPKGEDLGRVVDVLADASGRVRIAIIEFGGFLGVGNRRIAVDWSLLHFNPNDQSKPLTLSVSRQKLQTAPEYKNAPQPRALMAPPAPPTPPASPTPASPTPASPTPASPTQTSPAPSTPTSPAPSTPTSPAPSTPTSPAPSTPTSPAPSTPTSPAPAAAPQTPAPPSTPNAPEGKK
jgi:PRC-barrel domain